MQASPPLSSFSFSRCFQLFLLLARQNGALGSRLTGAGWGGCTVSLVRQEAVAAFCEQVKKQYYHEILHLKDEQIQQKDALFATEPGGGAAVLMLNAKK